MASTQDSPHAGQDASINQRLGPRTETLRVPLATILGHTQYLKRHFLNGRSIAPDDFLTALSTIERSVWALEGHLRVLENERDRRGQGDT